MAMRQFWALLTGLTLSAATAFAGLPFTFGWEPGTVRVESSEQYDGVKVRRTYDLTLATAEDGFELTGKNVEVKLVEGTLAGDVIEELRAAPARPVELSGRGVAEFAGGDDAQSAAAIHEWNAVVGYWTGRDRSMNRAVKAKLPDGRILRLEHLGPVADPVGSHHLSVTVTGERPGAVRGCTEDEVEGLPAMLKGTADTAEMVHILDTVSCERTEFIEAVVEPDTLRPHLVVIQNITTIKLPGRSSMEKKSTIRRDYRWGAKKKR